MPRSSPAPALLLIAATAVGCSGSDAPAVCTSVDRLQDGMTDLEDVDVVHDGVDALQGSLTTVKNDLQDVVSDGRSQYSAQVDGLQTDFSQLQTAVQTAVGSPSGDTVNGVVASIGVLADGVSSFADDVASTC